MQVALVPRRQVVGSRGVVERYPLQSAATDGCVAAAARSVDQDVVHRLDSLIMEVFLAVRKIFLDFF